MKVLITHSYYLQFDKKQLALSKPYPPLATLIVANVLRNLGNDVYLHDVSFDSSLQPLKKRLKEVNPDLLLICDDGFNYLTKMCLTNMREAAFNLLRFAKSIGVKTIISSSDSTDHYTDYLMSGADVVLLGEPESTLIELFDKGIRDFESIKGIAFKSNGNVKCNERRKVITQLDKLPFPAWDLIDIKPYKRAWEKHNYFSINVSTTRGCPYKCNWCAKPIYGNRYNVRSPEHVLNELKEMSRFFEFDHIWFCDDIFGLKPGWLDSFSKLLIESGMKLKYKIQCRADLLQNEELIDNLSKSGADEIWIGAESGSQKILDAMDKGINVEQIYQAVRLLKKYQMKPCLFLQFGYPGETKADILKTLKMVDELDPFDIGVSVSYPLPGTVFYEKVKASMKEKKNWKDSDELLLMYSGEYSATFYKALHRYVHKSFRAKQSWQELKKIFTLKNGNIHKALLTAYYKPASIILRSGVNLKEK
ncbi:MAG TPA: radical SAM protein [Bacteroidia bacterium]|nr:radical SAM protein [Bacteroidia bacterium]